MEGAGVKQSNGSWIAARDEPAPDVARLLAAVPEWFGQPDSNAEYIEAARTKETWTVRDADGTVVGVTLIERLIMVTPITQSGAGTGTPKIS